MIQYFLIMEHISYGIKKKTLIIVSVVLVIGILGVYFLYNNSEKIEDTLLNQLEGVISYVGETNNNTIGYEYLDSETLHFWNDIDDYYLNMSSSIQFSNHYQEYWTHNIFCAGYKTGSWNYLCSDTLPISMNVISDNLTYVQISGTRIVTIAGRDIEMGIDYYLELGDNFLNVTPSLEHISGTPITNDLAFAWRVNNIQINNDVENDRIFVNNTWYNLNESLDMLFTNMSRKLSNDEWVWNGNCTSNCNEDPSNVSCVGCWDIIEVNSTQYLPFYILRDLSTINLRWNENLNYFLQVKNNSQYNTPITLAIVTTGLNVNQTKKASFQWKDPSGLSDTFTDSDGTHLPDHVADGVDWTTTDFVVLNANDIQNNAVDIAAFRSEFWASDSGENCSEITVLGIDADTPWLSYAGVLMTDANDRGYNLQLGSPASGNWTRLILDQDTSFITQVTELEINRSIDHIVRLIANSSAGAVTLNGSVDGEQLIYITDTTSVLTSGNSGIGTSTDAASGQVVLDDWNDCFAAPEEDTCGCPTSGDWNVDCSDGCKNLTLCDINDNDLILSGTGNFTIGADIIVDTVRKDKNCQVWNEKGDGNSLIVNK